MKGSDIEKLNEFEDEDRPLEQILNLLNMECRALKFVIEKTIKPAMKREFASSRVILLHSFRRAEQ